MGVTIKAAQEATGAAGGVAAGVAEAGTMSSTTAAGATKVEEAAAGVATMTVTSRGVADGGMMVAGAVAGTTGAKVVHGAVTGAGEEGSTMTVNTMKTGAAGAEATMRTEEAEGVAEADTTLAGVSGRHVWSVCSSACSGSSFRSHASS